MEIAAVNDKNEDMLQQAQASEIEELKQKVAELTESKEQLELRNQKLADESLYAKGLASAAAVELEAFSEVAKLMNDNERLAAELAAVKNSPTQRSRTSGTVRNSRRENHMKRPGPSWANIRTEERVSYKSRKRT